MIFVIGVWRNLGPRANDCTFEVACVTTDPIRAELAKSRHPDRVIMEAEDGSEFYDWEESEGL